MAPNDDPLVSTEWLAAHLDDPKVRVIDATFKLPGAFPLPNRRLPRRAPYSGRRVLRCRRGERSPAIPIRICIRMRRSSRATSRRSAFPPAIPWWLIIRAAASQRRGRGGCSCRSAIPNQGARWRPEEMEARGTADGIRQGRGQTGQVHRQARCSYIRSQQQVLKNIDSKAEQLVARSPRDASRASRRSRARNSRSGHIPGSRNVSYAGLVDAETGVMKPLEEFRKAFTGAGVDLAKPIVTSCGSGRLGARVDARALLSARRARHRIV